ncbi:helix-turn-helix transcriptional regulator [Microlunatus soli]|nr:AraC family transcriptional regulator [Microlunatus soli]
MTELSHRPLTDDAVLSGTGPLWLTVLSGGVTLETAAGVIEVEPGDAAWLDARTAYRVTVIRPTDLATGDLRATGLTRRLPSPMLVRGFTARHAGVASLIKTCPLDGSCQVSVLADGYGNLLGAAMVDSWLQDEGLGAEGPEQDDLAVTQVIAAVRAEPANPWTAASMAGLVHLSRSTLGERFRKAVGRSPIQLVREVRMGEARRLLLDPSHPVEYVASAVGYGSLAAFSRAFAGQHGVSPQAWRAQEAQARARGDRNAANPTALANATTAPTDSAVVTP